MADIPWREAIITVLKEENAAMRYTAIAERIVENGLRVAVGATPASTVSATITTSINSEGDSPFRRVGRGVYVLADVIAVPPPGPSGSPAETVDGDLDEPEGPIHAFGMFWDRAMVRWASTPAILGRQQIGANPVDMAPQRGIYLLHDLREVIYVGRSIDRHLGKRLYEHTLDRLKTRWNRFSWFGLCRVSDDGSLGDPTSGQSTEAIIAAMEAILIEALEPAQNRRRGDGFFGVEFIQAEDPEIEKAQFKLLMAELQKKI